MNGFDHLERQLRKTVTLRASSGRRRTLRTMFIAVGVLASAGTVAAAATGLMGHTVVSGVDRVSPVEKLLTDVLHAAEKAPGCAPRRLDRRPATLSARPADAATIRAFPQLRRPPTAHERAAARKYGRAGGSMAVLSGGARELRAADGTRFLLIIKAGRVAKPGVDGNATCFAVQRAELERRASSIEPAVLAEAHRSLDGQEKNYRVSLGRESLLLVELASSGRMGGYLATYSDVAIRQGTGSTGGTITGLVPEPADHVILRARAGHAKPIRIQVPQRVFHQARPKGFRNRVTIEWRTSDGRLLHTLSAG